MTTSELEAAYDEHLEAARTAIGEAGKVPNYTVAAAHAAVAAAIAARLTPKA